MNIKRYFKLAKNASEMSDYKKDNIRIGAIIVRKNKIIGVGWNSKKSSPIQKIYNVHRTTEDRQYDVELQSNCIHAETSAICDALRRYNGNLNKCSIFIYRTNKGLCKPCSACSKMLKDYGINNIYYTNGNNGFNYERRS